MKIGLNLIPFTSVQGTEVYIKNILSNVLNIAKDDEFYIFQSERVPSFLKFGNFNNVREVLIKGLARKYSLAFYQQTDFYRLLKRAKVNILFCPSPAAPLFYKDKIVAIHDCAYDRFTEFDNLLTRAYFRAMFYGAKYFGKKIVTVSNFCKKEIMELYKVPEGNIEVIYEAAPELPEVTDDFVRRVLAKFKILRPYFLFVGIFRPRKNLLGLIKAFKLFREISGEDYLLVIAGRIDRRFIDMKKAIKENRLESDIILTDFATREQVAVLYRKARALCLPCFYEGFGLPVLEAQSMGTPVLTSNTSSLPEIAGKGAYYVNPYDIEDIAQGMKRLACDQAICPGLIKNGFENIKRFSWGKSARQLLNLFHSQ